MPPLRDVGEVLREARPTWDDSTVEKAESKLASIGIRSVDDLAKALQEQLNERLQEAGLKIFAPETLEALKDCLGIHSEMKKSAEADGHGEHFEDIPDLGSLLADLDREENDEPREDPWLKERAIGLGIPLTRLEHPDQLPSLLDQIERLEVMTVSKLRSEYEQRGFIAPEDLTSRSELVPLVRNALIWEAMRIQDLFQVCKARGLEPCEDQQSRSDLMRLLARPTWQASGIPVDRFACISDAVSALDQVKSLDVGDFPALTAQSMRYGLPVRSRSAQELLGQLKKFFVWSHLPVLELEKECQALGLLLEAKNESVTEGAFKGELLRRLVLSIWGPDWIDIWRRLGSFELLEALMRQVEHLQSLNIPSIQLQYKEHSLPFDTVLEKHVLIDRLRDVLIWKQIPLERLRVEREALDIPPISDCGDEESERKESITWLVLSSWKSTWDAWGIPALRLGNLMQVEAQMRMIDMWRSMKKTELRAEFRSIKMPFDSSLNTKELIDRLQIVMLWRQLAMNQLREECSHHGVCSDVCLPGEDQDAMERASASNASPQEDPQSYEDIIAALDARELNEDGDADAAERKELIRRLVIHIWSDTWESWSIPARKLSRLEVISIIMEELDNFKGMDLADIRTECKARGVPCDNFMDRQASVNRLRDYLVWKHLPMEDLHQECKVHKADVGASCQRDEIIKRLLECACTSAWEAQGIPVGRLPDDAAASRLVEQLEQVELMDRASLADWYTSMGFTDDKDLDKKALASMLRNVTIWQALPKDELQEECTRQGLSVPEEWTSAVLVQRVVEDEDEQRQKLVHLLFTDLRMRAWETKDLPARRIGSLETVIFVRQQLKRIDSMRFSELEAWYEGTHLPKEKNIQRSEMTRLLKLVTVWDALPLDELIKECEKREIPINDPDQAGDDDDRKQRVQIQLLLHERMASWESHGFQAHRIGNADSVMQLVTQYEHFKTMSVKELQKTYQEVGLPEDASLGKDDILKALLTVVTWELLPITELHKDCQVRNLPTAVDKNAPGANDVDDGERWELVRRLKCDMIVKMNRGWYEERGIPVDKLGALQIADLATRYKDVDAMSMEELVTWYKSTGLPKEKNLERTEIQKLLKKVTLWNMLSLPDLWKECDQNQIAADDVDKRSSNEEQQQKLRVHLLLKERMDAWDAKGFQAHRLGNVDTVLQAIQQYTHFESLEDEELFDTCSKAGLPSQREVRREEVLQKLRQILLWELLPLVELRKECLERKLPNLQGKPTERQASIRWLTLSTWNNTWAERGIPAERLGNLDVTASIIEEYDRLHAGVMYNDMVGEGIKFLQAQYKKMGMPYDPDLKRDQHINRLRDLYIWQYLPIAELRAECKANGAWSISNANADERSELIKRLVFSAWTDTWAVRGIPARRLSSYEVAQALIEQVDKLRGMSFIALRSECQAKGVRVDQHMDREVTWRRLKDVLVWRSLPIMELQRECLDRGIAVSQNIMSSPGALRGLAPRQADVHTNLVRRLLDYTYLKEWADQGVPVLEIDNTKMTIQTLEEVDLMSEADYRRWYRQAGFPDEGDITKKELGILLKKVKIWQIMKLEQVQKECFKRKLQVGTCREQKDKLINMLLGDERMGAWQAKGLPVQRVSTVEGMIQLIASYKHADQMKLSDLIDWYRRTGLPVEKGMERDELIGLLKIVTLWNVLPLSELQKECAENNVTIDEASKEGDDERQRQQLGVLLLLNTRMAVWEAKGYQARRMGKAETVMSAVHRLEEFRSMTDEELEKTYNEIGLPKQEDMKREDRLNTLKTILTWEMLPHAELMKDCKERGLSVDLGDVKNEEEKTMELLNRLRVDMVVKMTKESLEKRGVPVSRLGTLQAARVASQFDHFEALSNEDLKKTFVDAGFPFESIMERSYLLEKVKTLVVWEMLPLKALQTECLALGLPIQTGRPSASDEFKCSELAERLRMDLSVKMNSTWYEQKGIPISQVSTLKAAHVAEQFVKFADMNLVALRRAHTELGMPIDFSMSREDLHSRLREATIWKATPLDRLRSECESRGVDFKQATKLQGMLEDDAVRGQLLDMLLLKICESTFKVLKVPLEKFISCKAASSLADEWSKIDKSTEAELLVMYDDLGVSPQFLGWKEVRSRLKTAAVWKHGSLKDLQDECRNHQVYGFGNRDDQSFLITRLAKALWPPKPNPKPKPRPPPPPPPPPPPRQPPAQSSFFKISKHFQTLELPSSAGLDEVKKAYRRLALKYHPDKNVGDGQKLAAQAFREVAEAYEKLSDHLRTRTRYRS